MRYRQRNPDGSLGEWVETEVVIQPELLAAYEALALMNEELENVKTEIKQLKGGSNK